jgi:hypothetical protein
MRLKIAFLMFVQCIVIGCIEVRDPDAQKESQVRPASQQSFQWELRPLSAPQKYEVILKGVPEGSQVARKSLNFLKQVPTEVTISRDSIYKDVVDSEGTFEYLIQSGTQVTKVEVTVPQDLVLQGELSLESLPVNIQRAHDEWTTLETEGRIYFQAGALITTQGTHLLIKARSIESEGATIQTLKPDQSAEALKEGRNGGRIKLVSDDLRGTLHFVMRGEKGGTGQLPWQGRKGVPFDSKGRRGGNSGLLISEIKDLSRGGITFELEPGVGGEGTELKSFCMGEHCKPDTIVAKGPNGRAGVAEQPVGLSK